MVIYGFWFYQELKDMLGFRPIEAPGQFKKHYVLLHTPNHGMQLVKSDSSRLELLKINPTCVRCGRTGHVWILESHVAEAPHLNLYHVGEPVSEWKNLSKDGLIMMTRDHVIPKSKGGANTLDNSQTMCAICNGIKADKMPDHIKNRAARRHEQKIDLQSNLQRYIDLL